ncbi:MAG: EamA family transporter [Actinobacteria bacterium]|nr:EamA family transporter [Actinomycetota bacterium]
MGGYFKVAIAAIIWGSLGVVVRLIDLPVPVMVFYRVFFASVAILIFITAQGKIESLSVGKNIYVIFLMGAILALNWVSFFNSVQLTSIANAVLLTYTAPVFVAILVPFVLKESLERITIITLMISLIGIALITAPPAVELSRQDLSGIAWAFVSAITYAVLVLLAKPLTLRVSVLAILFFEEISCAAVLSPSLFIYQFDIEPLTMLALFMLGAFHTALAAGLYLSGLREIKAQQVGIFTYLDPVSAVVFAAIFLGEIPRITTFFGGLLIIISGLIIVLATRRRVETEVVAE